VLSFTYKRFVDSNLIRLSDEEQGVKFYLDLIFTLLILLATSCQAAAPVCPPDSVTYISEVASLKASTSVEDLAESPTPILVEINGKEMLFDDVIHGVLCGGEWRGTVYVACDLQIAAWEEEPTFLEDCDLNIEPGTVVYVAAHNDAPYYKGCSCHTGEGVSE
jgi:hypothetical protein